MKKQVLTRYATYEGGNKPRTLRCTQLNSRLEIVDTVQVWCLAAPSLQSIMRRGVVIIRSDPTDVRQDAILFTLSW